MMLVCLSCAFALRVLHMNDGERALVGKGSDFWPDGYECPCCGKKAQVLWEDEVASDARARLSIRDVTSQELFLALHGMGLPEERACSIEAVTELLKEHPIRKVYGHTVSGTGRSCLTCLELWDGSKVYLGSSSVGAIVYRISRPHSYVQALEERNEGPQT